MTTTLDGPADTRLMGIVHDALRRDLTRARAVLTTDLAPSDAQRTVLAEHLGWMMRFLHEHHESEDAGLYPMVRARNAGAVTLLDAMDAEHHAILGGMDALEAAASAYASDPAGGPAVLAAIDRLERTLLPHLRREESEMMPVVAATITEREWQGWDQTYNIGPLRPPELAKRGLWILDGLAGADRAHVEGLVPAVPRWLILNVGGPMYRRLAFRLWGLPDHTGVRMPLRASTDVVVDAPPEAVWSVLADPARVGEWSHECQGAQWLGGATEAAVGARFRGRNRVGRMRWSRPCTITHLETGRSLGWRTDGGVFGDATEWRIDLEPAGVGTRIVQRYRVLSMPRWFERFVWRAMPSHHDRSAALRGDLERLGEVARERIAA